MENKTLHFLWDSRHFLKELKKDYKKFLIFFIYSLSNSSLRISSQDVSNLISIMIFEKHFLHSMFFLHKIKIFSKNYYCKYLY